MADNQQEKEEKLKSMSDAVKVVIDNYPDRHKLYGNELKDDVVKIYPDAVNMYVDTILKMARRHRRESLICIDHNNSLYQKVAKKSIIEQIKEVIPKEPPAERPESVPAQGLLFPLAVVFFVLFLGAFFALESTFGRPRTEFFIASKSSSLYIPAVPTYRYGVIPFLCNLLLTASDDIPPPNLSAITTAVSISIYPSIYRKNIAGQGENAKMFRHRNIKKMATGSPGSRKAPKRAEGEFYGKRAEKFSGMA